MEGWLKISRKTGGRSHYFILDANEMSINSGKTPNQARSDPKKLLLASLKSVCIEQEVLIVVTIGDISHDFKADSPLVASEWKDAIQAIIPNHSNEEETLRKSSKRMSTRKPNNKEVLSIWTQLGTQQMALVFGIVALVIALMIILFFK